MARACRICGDELCMDHCGWCGADGCEAGTAVHADDCPSQTGLYPVEEHAYGPPCERCGHVTKELVPYKCGRCEHEFGLGETYHHIQIGESDMLGRGLPIYESVCAGCAAEEALL